MDNYAFMELYFNNNTRITTCINTNGTPCGWCPGVFNYNSSTNTWYFFTVVYTGNSINLYINGNPIGTASVAGITKRDSLAKNMIIGGRSIDTYINRWDGILDEITIWNRALTQTEINALHNEGNGLSLIQ